MKDAFELFREQALLLNEIMDRGHLTFDEVKTLAQKMADIRSTNGFGKIVAEMTRNNGQDVIRIRKIEDVVLKPLPFEKD